MGSWRDQDYQKGRTMKAPGHDVGFTLIELLVVITIIGIMASVVVVNLFGVDDQARVARVQADFSALRDACNRFKLDHRRWPASLEELHDGPEWRGEPTRYIERPPQDPWTQVAYAMEFNDDGRPYFVSLGADQAEGGEGFNQDLASNDGFDD